jgi:hypothetical protein
VEAVERLRYDDETAFLLADNAATVARIVRTVPVERLRATRFGEWTAVELLGHLADAAEIFADRVRRCIEEDRPPIASYDQDAIAAERRNAERDPMELSRRVMDAHGRMVQLLVQVDRRTRPGVHGEWGEVDAGHFAAYQARHASEHVADLARAFPPTA